VTAPRPHPLGTCGAAPPPPRGGGGGGGEPNARSPGRGGGGRDVGSEQDERAFRFSGHGGRAADRRRSRDPGPGIRTARSEDGYHRGRQRGEEPGPPDDGAGAPGRGGARAARCGRCGRRGPVSPPSIPHAAPRRRRGPMISFVPGGGAEKGGGSVVLSVGGVGYEVLIPASSAGALPPVGRPARLYTRMQIRDDSMVLYGFASHDERALFDLFVPVAGVGPKLALSFLSVLSPVALRRAVAAGDVAALTLVPGVGKKVAQRVMLDLKDKLGGDVVVVEGPLAEVREALLALGLSAGGGSEAMAEIPADGDRPVDELLRQALQHVGRGWWRRAGRSRRFPSHAQGGATRGGARRAVADGLAGSVPRRAGVRRDAAPSDAPQVRGPGADQGAARAAD